LCSQLTDAAHIAQLEFSLEYNLATPEIQEDFSEKSVKEK